MISSSFLNEISWSFISVSRFTVELFQNLRDDGLFIYENVRAKLKVSVRHLRTDFTPGIYTGSTSEAELRRYG
jgi:hypothetical protein